MKRNIPKQRHRRGGWYKLDLFFQPPEYSQTKRTLPTSSIHRNLQRNDQGRSSFNMRPSAANCPTQKKKRTTFLLERDNTAIVSCAPIARTEHK